MERNKATTLYFKNGKFEILIGEGIRANVIMDMAGSSFTYIVQSGSESETKPIESIPFQENLKKILKLLTDNFPKGETIILYDGEIFLGSDHKAFLSRIVITQPLTA